MILSIKRHLCINFTGKSVGGTLGNKAKIKIFSPHDQLPISVMKKINKLNSGTLKTILLLLLLYYYYYYQYIADS